MVDIGCREKRPQASASWVCLSWFESVPLGSHVVRSRRSLTRTTTTSLATPREVVRARTCISSTRWMASPHASFFPENPKASSMGSSTHLPSHPHRPIGTGVPDGFRDSFPPGFEDRSIPAWTAVFAVFLGWVQASGVEESAGVHEIRAEPPHAMEASLAPCAHQVAGHRFEGACGRSWKTQEGSDGATGVAGDRQARRNGDVCLRLTSPTAQMGRWDPSWMRLGTSTSPCRCVFERGEGRRTRQGRNRNDGKQARGLLGAVEKSNGRRTWTRRPQRIEF